MPIEQDNERFAREAQAWLRSLGYNLKVDGWAGKRTRSAFDSAQALLRRTGSYFSIPRWPQDDTESLRAFYGEPGEGNLVFLDLPYAMRLSWDLNEVVHHVRCHRLVAASLHRCLSSLLVQYGRDGVEQHNLNVLGGVYEHRTIGGSSRPSTHSWGVAIDLDPEGNPSHANWPQEAKMPLGVIETFEREGWTSLAKKIGRDAMHFEATS